MTFLYPSFLWALAALAIPVLIHLFNFRRTVKVYFSNNRFLRQVKEVTTAKRKVKHYLILASRLLFLAFLVFAFAQPLIPAKEQMAADRNVNIYIDNSQSMSAPLADNSRGIESSLAFATSIVNIFPADTRYRILTNDFAPFSNVAKTKPEALDILAQIKLTSVSRTMQEVTDRFSQNASRKQDIFWISDFQKSTLGSSLPQFDSLTQLHLVPVEFDNVANVFVDSAYLENPFGASGEKNQLIFILRNDGASEVVQMNVKLTINNIQAGATVVDIPAKGTTDVTFDIASGLTGLNRAHVSFNDAPISFDNEFFVALNFTDKINIIEIKQSSSISPVERVFGNEKIFNFSSYAADNLNYSLLQQAELVVVNGLNKLDPSLTQSLRNFLTEKAGSILLIPGTTPDLASYREFTNLQLSAIPVPEEFWELDRPDFNDPFFENVFEEKSLSLAMPRGKKIFDWGTDRSAVLRFKNGQPFLSQVNQGGKLFLMASPLQSAYSDFFNHAIFVPVMYKIAASSKKNDSRLYFSLNEDFIRLRLDSSLNDEAVRMIGPTEILPSQRQVNNEIFLDLPKFSISQGFYAIVANRDTTTLIAFNAEKAESLLDQYNAEQIKNQMGNGSNISIFEAGSADAFAAEIKSTYLGKPLWKYALMLALFFLLAEVLLIRFLK